VLMKSEIEAKDLQMHQKSAALFSWFTQAHHTNPAKQVRCAMLHRFWRKLKTKFELLVSSRAKCFLSCFCSNHVQIFVNTPPTHLSWHNNTNWKHFELNIREITALFENLREKAAHGETAVLCSATPNSRSREPS
jgi:hypothetical protein